MLLLGLAIGLLAGAIIGWLLRPKLEVEARKILPFLPQALADALLISGSLPGRLDAAIAEVESQIRQGVDRERNATRLQILREVRDAN